MIYLWEILKHLCYCMRFAHNSQVLVYIHFDKMKSLVQVAGGKGELVVGCTAKVEVPRLSFLAFQCYPSR